MIEKGSCHVFSDLRRQMEKIWFESEKLTFSLISLILDPLCLTCGLNFSLGCFLAVQLGAVSCKCTVRKRGAICGL